MLISLSLVQVFLVKTFYSCFACSSGYTALIKFDLKILDLLSNRMQNMGIYCRTEIGLHWFSYFVCVISMKFVNLSRHIEDEVSQDRILIWIGKRIHARQQLRTKSDGEFCTYFPRILHKFLNEFDTNLIWNPTRNLYEFYIEYIRINWEPRAFSSLIMCPHGTDDVLRL